MNEPLISGGTDRKSDGGRGFLTSEVLVYGGGGDKKGWGGKRGALEGTLRIRKERLNWNDSFP